MSQSKKIFTHGYLDPTRQPESFAKLVKQENSISSVELNMIPQVELDLIEAYLASGLGSAFGDYFAEHGISETSSRDGVDIFCCAGHPIGFGSVAEGELLVSKRFVQNFWRDQCGS